MGSGEAFAHIMLAYFSERFSKSKKHYYIFQHFSGIFVENCQFPFSEKMRIENKKKTKRKGTLKVKIPKRKQSNATLIHFLALELIRKRPYDAYLSKRA